MDTTYFYLQLFDAYKKACVEKLTSASGGGGGIFFSKADKSIQGEEGGSICTKFWLTSFVNGP